MPTEGLPGKNIPVKDGAVSVGADLGGTWLRICAVDARGRLWKKTRAAAPTPAGLAVALRRLWKAWGISRVARLTVGSKGVWKKAARRGMAASLRGLAERVEVMSDVELAYLAAIGEKPGVLILAGTGSIALARDGKGRWSRAGGLGPEKGDEGSGFWIGREYRRRVLGKGTVVSPFSVRRTAALARRVIALSKGNAACAGIVEEAADGLAALADEARRRAGLKAPLTVAWAGGVLENAGVRRKVYARLGKAGRIFPAHGKVPAEKIAALLGLKKMGK